MAGQRFYIRNNNGNVYLANLIGVPSTLYEVSAQNLSGIDLWLHVFDVDVLPPNGTQALYAFKVATNGTIAIAPPAGPMDQGRPFGLGIFAGWCSTALWANEPGPFGESIIYLAGRQ